MTHVLDEITRDVIQAMSAGEQATLIQNMEQFWIDLCHKTEALKIDLHFVQSEQQREEYSEQQKEEYQASVDRMNETRFV